MTPIIVKPFEKMTEKDAQNSRMASQELYRHWAHSSRVDERMECSACTLQGYTPSGKEYAELKEQTRKDGPNYAGWARVYVEAGAKVPHKWREAFKAELDRTDNPAYVNALRHSIAVWGLRIA